MHRSLVLISLLIPATLFAEPPKPLHPGAVTEDWPRFLGPKHNGHSAETHLLKDWPEGGPAVVWETGRGRSHTGPVIAGDHLVFIHEVDGREVIECRHAISGEEKWEFGYPVEIRQSYGITDAPRSGPVIDGDRVYTSGVDGDLHCLELKSGEVIWKLNLEDEFGEAPFFFGRGSCPLVRGERLIVHAGAPGACVVALDKMTGEVMWKTGHDWNGSYASPIPAQLHGKERVLLMAGGMTNPPHGGLLCLDPENGRIDDAVSWRSTMFASVLAASPVPVENGAFITEDYGRGGALVEFSPDLKASIRWKAPGFACQFTTPVAHEGYLYGYDSGSYLVCYEIESGREMWRKDLRMEVEFEGRNLTVDMGRGSLVHADGAFLSMGEQGTLLWLDLSPEGVQVLRKAQLFYSPETWGMPALSKGLLYVNQNGATPRLICYDLRQPAP